jgi:hypothetical protein
LPESRPLGRLFLFLAIKRLPIDPGEAIVIFTISSPLFPTMINTPIFGVIFLPGDENGNRRMALEII